MKLIAEVVEDINYITEAKDNGKGKNYFIEGVFMQGDLKNRNGRTYPAQVLAKEVKSYMFTFDDIATLQDIAVQKIVAEVDAKIMAIALKTTTEEMKDKVVKNMSERAAEMLQDEMQYVKDVPEKDVDVSPIGSSKSSPSINIVYRPVIDPTVPFPALSIIFGKSENTEGV